MDEHPVMGSHQPPHAVNMFIHVTQSVVIKTLSHEDLWFTPIRMWPSFLSQLHSYKVLWLDLAQQWRYRADKKTVHRQTKRRMEKRVIFSRFFRSLWVLPWRITTSTSVFCLFFFFFLLPGALQLHDWPPSPKQLALCHKWKIELRYKMCRCWLPQQFKFDKNVRALRSTPCTPCRGRQNGD